tara:strand:- start:845 stop:1339 length:495 start_codon:yes stop_codon:yes gene_type:complete
MAENHLKNAGASSGRESTVLQEKIQVMQQQKREARAKKKTKKTKNGTGTSSPLVVSTSRTKSKEIEKKSSSKKKSKNNSDKKQSSSSSSSSTAMTSSTGGSGGREDGEPSPRIAHWTTQPLDRITHSLNWYLGKYFDPPTVQFIAAVSDIYSCPYHILFLIFHF